ncbi:MAG: hypothetical protein ACLTSK_03330 [Christensenellales bacterium]
MSIFKSEKIEKSLGVVLDVLFALVLLFSLFMTVSTLAQRENGVAGLRFGVIRSKSMEASELYVGDVVFVNREDQYDVGDVIVFYRAVAQYKNAFSAELVKDCPVWVHEVVAVSTDAEGRRTYLTKGTSNVFDDGYYVPQDFVLGKATPLPAFLNKTVGFVGSKAGIISLIICPCAAMTIYLVWELVILFTARDAAAETQGGGNTAKRTATTVDDALSSAAIAFDDATDKNGNRRAEASVLFNGQTGIFCKNIRRKADFGGRRRKKTLLRNKKRFAFHFGSQSAHKQTVRNVQKGQKAPRKAERKRQKDFALPCNRAADDGSQIFYLRRFRARQILSRRALSVSRKQRARRKIRVGADKAFGANPFPDNNRKGPAGLCAPVKKL